MKDCGIKFNGVEMTETKSFKDAIKQAAALKAKAPVSKTSQVQQAKFKNQVQNNKPTRRNAGRGG